jgi:hypothetical protein
MPVDTHIPVSNRPETIIGVVVTFLVSILSLLIV